MENYLVGIEKTYNHARILANRWNHLSITIIYAALPYAFDKLRGKLCIKA